MSNKCNCDLHDIDQILPGLYIGNYITSQCSHALSLFNINAVINCSKINNKPITSRYLFVYTKDEHGFYICRSFRQVNEFIEKCLSENINILVHCMYGMSRSPTLVAAYLIKTKQLNRKDALHFIKERRYITDPIAWFHNQLDDYYKYLYSN